MHADQRQLLDDGYLILRDLIAPEQVAQLRKSIETMIDRRMAISVEHRHAWDTSAQPRLQFDKDCDETTVDAIEFCLQDNTFGVSRRLMGAPEAVVTYMACMCSSTGDHGPANWHRDVYPPELAPLRGLQMNTLHYGPTYLQWNIPLYDDSVLWVVPGSHRRPSTDAENRQLAENPKVPLPGSIPVELRAGDGVVYTHLILHWGSNYSHKLRRTVHLGYRSVGSPSFPIVHWRHWDDLRFTRILPALARAQFETFDRLIREEFDVIESIFRAMINKDRAAFEAGLTRLHPGDTGRMVSVIMLSKLAFKMQRFTQPDLDSLPPDERTKRASANWPNVHDFERLAGRFPQSDVALLCQRFGTLDDRLKRDTEQTGLGFQGARTEYEFNDMPADFEVEDFIKSWNQ